MNSPILSGVAQLSTSEITRQSPCPNPPLKRGLHLPYSADGMGEGSGGAASKTALCRPKAFRLISARADSGRSFGPFCALHFRAAWCVRTHRVRKRTRSLPSSRWSSRQLVPVEGSLTYMRSACRRGSSSRTSCRARESGTIRWGRHRIEQSGSVRVYFHPARC